MAGEIQIHVIGNLTNDPELRYTNGGTAVANFSVASTPRVFDKASGQWQNGEATFLRCTLWREMAEHAAESLSRGMRVVLVGTLVTRSYETKEGETRSGLELNVEEIGPSLRYATTKVSKATRPTAAPAAGDVDSWATEPPY